MQIEKLLEEQETIEHFANLEHERWSKWQKYMHSKFVEHSDGKGEFVCLPIELFKRWEKQINTPYSELSEQEKQSDRGQVMPYVNWHKQSLKQFIDGLVERMEKQKYQQPLLGTPETTERVMYAVNQTLDEEISHLKEIRNML